MYLIDQSSTDRIRTNTSYMIEQTFLSIEGL